VLHPKPLGCTTNTPLVGVGDRSSTEAAGLHCLRQPPLCEQLLRLDVQSIGVVAGRWRRTRRGAAANTTRTFCAAHEGAEQLGWPGMPAGGAATAHRSATGSGALQRCCCLRGLQQGTRSRMMRLANAQWRPETGSGRAEDRNHVVGCLLGRVEI